MRIRSEDRGTRDFQPTTSHRLRLILQFPILHSHSHLRNRPRGAAWSARRPVKAKIVGSNPIGDARNIDEL